MSYDVFLSHSHDDRDWTRALYELIAATEYNGRRLRAWLDAEFLDPGDLSSARELESALDRSRRLVLVISEASLASRWVGLEIDYFLKRGSQEHVVAIRRGAPKIPSKLAGSKVIEWPGAVDDEERRMLLLRCLRPFEDDLERVDHGRSVRRACRNARAAMGRDFDPTPTSETRELQELLLSYDIADLDREGIALAGFEAAGQYVCELDDAESYAMRMVLGEYLAIATLRSPDYARVARDFIGRDEESAKGASFITLRNRLLEGKSSAPSTTHLLHSVARSSSKLAAIDAAQVDLSTIAGVLHRLDQRSTLGTQERLVALVASRALARLRGSSVTDALLWALAEWGGDASQIAAAFAISGSLADSDVFYTDALREMTGEAKKCSLHAPSSRIAMLLLEPLGRLDLNPSIASDVQQARADYAQAFGAWDHKMDGSWPNLAYAPPASRLTSGPLAGTVRRVSLDNMESLADQLGPAELALLAQPRIVDALFEHAGGFLIDEREIEAPLGDRLRSRGARFATYRPELLGKIQEGSALVVWPTKGVGSANAYIVAGDE